MSTPCIFIGDAVWVRPPEEYPGNPSLPQDNNPPAAGPAQPLTPRDQSVGAAMNEFVEMLKDNPNVWAVCATANPDGISVWTYIDSSNRTNRLAVYEVEWRLMKAHPGMAFDFNTVSVPVGNEEFDEDELDFLYRR